MTRLPAKLPPEADRYIAEARRVIALVKKSFTFPDGTLFLERTGSKVFAHHIFPDLGDVLPFFLYFGEDEFVAHQVSLYEAQLKDGFLVSDFPSLGIRGLVKSYEYTDLLLGLAAYAGTAPEGKRILTEAVRAGERAFSWATRPRSLYHLQTGIQLPVIDTRDATLIECFTTLYRQTNDDRFLDYGMRVFEALTATPFYRTHGLFADYEPTNAVSRMLLANNPKTRSATLCKNTTNALFAFLDLYRLTKDETVRVELLRTAHAVAQLAQGKNGGVIERFQQGSASQEVRLTPSFAYLDFLCDLAATMPEESEWALLQARDVADAWLSVQGETGLFPLAWGGIESFIDSETDMVVALTKLAERTGETKYRDAAVRCRDGLMHYHGGHDYPLGVDIHSGDVINPTQRTKFLCLFLKLLILEIELLAGSSIYGDDELFELLKDR
jgi:hypothetical protein